MSGIAKVKRDGRFLIVGSAGSAVIDYHEGELWRFHPSPGGANMLCLEFGEDIHMEVTVQKFYAVFDVIKRGQA
jgi:hypothetical protein